MKYSQALAVGFLLFSGCTKVEKIIETRQASPNIRESFIQNNQKTLSLKTSALGKVFMLVANSKTTGQQPRWIEHPIKLITFEKSGTQMGLFEVNYSQIYRSLDSQKILQTFEIVSETSEQVTINIEKGFTVLNSVRSYEVMRPNKTEEAFKEDGSEVSAVVKDLLVKSADVQNDKVHIIQFSRVQTPALLTVAQRRNKITQETPVLTDVENSYDTRIDIFPYSENKNFKPKEQDPEWTVGMFLSRILKEASSQSEALTTRWDTTQPIRYIIVGQPPKEAIPSIK
ncbi:MAG TPA: hypothetical protein VIG33_00465, partial [Pseudobdellovibrionaceae bacterium]